MKRLIALVVLLLAGFYIAWPAWSGYQIHQALQNKNTGLLESKIDFARVRTSLRPVMTTKVGEGIEKFQSQAGPMGAILGQLKGDFVPKIVETALANVVNPAAIMRVATEGGSMKEAVEKIIREQVGQGGLGGLGGGGQSGGLGGLGGLLGKVMKPGSPVRDVNPDDNSQPPAGREQSSSKTSAKFSLSNIKMFRLAGPFTYRVGVAKDADASEPDVTAELSFTGGDWKVTGLVPKL
jgi:hypothetical protein